MKPQLLAASLVLLLLAACDPDSQAAESDRAQVSTSSSTAAATPWPFSGHHTDYSKPHYPQTVFTSRSNWKKTIVATVEYGNSHKPPLVRKTITIAPGQTVEVSRHPTVIPFPVIKNISSKYK